MGLSKWVKGVGLVIGVLGLAGFLFGCGSVVQEQKKESTATAAPSAPPIGAKRSDRPDARYYDFEDVKIPNELSLDSKKSRVFQTPSLVAGVLAFDGYVEVNSIVAFFKDSMAKDNWQLKGYFKLPPKTVLLFEKKNKRCVITIEESMINTKVEVWVIPTQNGA
jgi:hypothetical protein